METKQKSDWCLICRFDVFAQSYTGLKNRSKIINFLADQDQIFNLSNNQFLAERDLMILWDEYVEIRPEYTLENNGIQCLSITTSVVGQNYYELECDCVDTKSLLRSIIKNLK